MIHGLVIGNATSTVKHASMTGWRLLVVQPLGPDDATPDGDPVLAVDSQGAGAGERVIITSDGKATGVMLGADNSPVRWSVVGVPDG